MFSGLLQAFSFSLMLSLLVDPIASAPDFDYFSFLMADIFLFVDTYGPPLFGIVRFFRRAAFIFRLVPPSFPELRVSARASFM